MTDELLDRVLMRSRAVSYKRCSPAYRWLRERHGQLAPSFSALDPQLGEIAAEMAAGGVTGGRGKILTAKALMRIWQRVCRDLRCEAANTAEKRRADTKVHPSRLAATWQPTPAQVSRVASSARTEPRHVPPSDSIDALPVLKLAVLDEEQAERIRQQTEILDAQLAYRDRFVNPPKRKA